MKTAPSEVAWSLLQEFLEQYESPGLTQLHKIISKRILQMNYSLPHWLYASYKKRNASELLMLFHQTGKLKEAAVLARDYILAVLGHGKEHFGFEYAMVPTGQPFCTPIYNICALLKDLELVNEEDSEKPLEKEYVMLKELLEKYQDTSARISNEMCRYRASQVTE